MLSENIGGYTQPQYHSTWGCTPIDLKDNTVAEHPWRRHCSVSLILFTQLFDSFHRPWISVGLFWFALSCRKAMTPLQIPSQHTVTASHSVSWEEKRLCDSKIKLCWGSVSVCEKSVCCRLFSDKCCFVTGRHWHCGVSDPWPWFRAVFWIVLWNLDCVCGLSCHIKSFWW